MVNKFIKTINHTYFVSNKLECVRRAETTTYGAVRNRLSLYQKIRILFGCRNEIPYIDLNVNNVCSLQCKNCDQGMPYYHNKKIFTASEIISNMDNLLKYVDYIYSVGIIGGEPLLNKDLNHIIEYCVNSCKIGQVALITNGTIFPEHKILNSLASAPKGKITLCISKYPLKNTSNRTRLLDYCRTHNIKTYINNTNSWLDFGDYFTKRNYSIKEKRTAFKECFLKDCVQYNEGYLFRCTKSRLLIDQKIEKPRNCEYINVKKIKNKTEMRKALKKFYSLSYLKACDYCNYGNALVKIPMGEQLRK